MVETMKVRFPKFMLRGETEVLLADVCWVSGGDVLAIIKSGLRAQVIAAHLPVLEPIIGPDGIAQSMEFDLILNADKTGLVANEAWNALPAGILICPDCGTAYEVVVVGGKAPEFDDASVIFDDAGAPIRVVH